MPHNSFVRRPHRAREIVLAGAFAFLCTLHAQAVDLGEVFDEPLRLDVTNVTAVSQRFLARTAEGERVNDFGWGAVANRLNVSLRWRSFTLGSRLDGVGYWLRPVDLQDVPSAALYSDSTTRFRNVMYPAKLWLSWQESGVDVTGGDVYAQMGRGLVLSLRKLDDLGVDTTLRGARLAYTKGIVSATAVAGFANPSRIDDATGASLFVADAVRVPSTVVNGDSFPARATFGSDRIGGVEVLVGRGTPVVVGISAMGLQRCAPFSYGASGAINETNVFSDTAGYSLGSCAEEDVARWLGSLPKTNPTYQAKTLWAAGPSLELPDLGAFGSLYLGTVFSNRSRVDGAWAKPSAGNAFYLNYTAHTGNVTHSVEAKSYRNFYPVTAAVNTNVNGMLAFSNVAYTLPPTTESLMQDSAFGFFNVCVDGGRYRADWRVKDGLVVSGQGSFFRSLTEQDDGGCTATRHGGISSDAVVPTGKSVKDIRDDVVDGFAAVQWDFDENTSHLYATLGGRNDQLGNETYYREAYINYTVSKHVHDAVTVELNGRHRMRYRESNNVDADGGAQPWREGENYTAVKIAPSWVVTHGFEYTTNSAQPTYYWNGSMLYRFDGSSNLRLFAGQQRGGLRCVSGVCRIFPAYEGVRAELTVRF